MEITKIEQQKKDKQRYSVFLDGKFAFGMTGTDVLYFKLREGHELSQERYDYILEFVVYEEAKKRAFNYISSGYRTEKEVRDKLTAKEYSQEIIEKVVVLLKSYNYIDDRQYAKKFFEYRMKTKGQGMLKIKFDLKMKGVSEDIINEFLLEYETKDSTDTIVNLIEEKAKGKKELDPKEKQRIYGFLMRRGFKYDEINAGFRRYLNNWDQ